MNEVIIPEEHNEHYKSVLADTKKEGDRTAEKRVPELYWILKNEEGKNPEDAREMVKQDLIDTFARVTVDKWIPEEAKNPDKVKAGKKGGKAKASNSASAMLSENHKESNENVKELQPIILTTGGQPAANEEPKLNPIGETPKTQEWKPKGEETIEDFKEIVESVLKQLDEEKQERIRYQNLFEKERKENLDNQTIIRKGSFKTGLDEKDNPSPAITTFEWPEPDEDNTFVFKDITFDAFRLKLGPLKAGGNTKINVYLERVK